MRQTTIAPLVAATVTVTTALGGCTWAGLGGAGARPSAAVRAWSPRDDLPAGLPGSRLWTTDATWSRIDAIRTGLPARMQWPTDTDIPGQPFDMVAVTGNVVVVATVGSGTATRKVTLRFINARTGALIASRSLVVSDFTGIRAGTIGREPVVEAQYGVMDERGDPGALVVDTVLDTSGHQVWTNGDRDPSNYVGSGYMVNDVGGYVTDGHTLWFNAGIDALGHGASYTVKDLSGRGLLTIPRWTTTFDPRNPLRGSINEMQLAGNYAVVIDGGPGKTAAAAPHAKFKVYDLSRGAKVVAAPTVTYPEGPNPANSAVPNPDPEAHVAAACGSKLVLTLTDASWTGPSSVRVTVLDVATGRTTPPVDVPSVRNSRYAGVLTGLADAACTTVVLNGEIVLTGPAPVPTAIAIDLSKGTLLWQKPEVDVTYHYLSIHDGVIYALRDPTLTSTLTATRATPARLIAIDAASGATLGTGFTAVPLGYAADGTPIFARVPNDPAPVSASPSPSPPLPVSQFRPLPSPPLSSTVSVQVWAGQPAT